MAIQAAYKASILLTATLGLGACGIVSRTADAILPDINSADFANSNFAATDGNGLVNLELVGVKERRINAAQAVGFAYKGGTDSEGDLRVVAGLNNVDDLAPPTFTGTATFSGRAYAIYANANTALERNAFTELEAPITVTANLGTGAISGETTETTIGKLQYRFAGQVNSSGNISAIGDFSQGNVDIDTTMTGKLSDREAVAVFHGAGTSVAVAGGIYATR